MFGDLFTRRKALGLLVTVPPLLACGPLFARYANAEETDDDAALKSRFEFLSQNGNVECSAKFEASIASMPPDAKLQGSCCAPMDEARYLQQIKGIRKYADIPEIPSDPYDIPASMAQKLMPYYNLSLNRTEQAAYDYAMAHSDMQGPCCCQCWRWRMYGGLGKSLIREHQFSGQQLVDLWNIASGCGGPISTKMH
jgi:hypothetical protein